MATSYVLITLGTGTSAVDFNIKGNLKSYEDVAAVPNSGFTAATADFTKTAGVVTPHEAMLASGSFRKLEAKSNDAKPKTRRVLIPTATQSIISAAIHSADGLSIDGIVFKTASEGLRRVAR